MSPTMDETKGQPTLMSIQTACLHFGGPLLTCRAFKQCGPRPLRGIANSEFTEAVNALEQTGLGKVRSFQVRFAPHPVQVFIKQKPENVNWPSDLCSQNDRRSKYNQNANKCISLPLSSRHWSMWTSFHKKCSQMFRYVTLAMNSTGTQYSCKEHLMRISI